MGYINAKSSISNKIHGFYPSIPLDGMGLVWNLPSLSPMDKNTVKLIQIQAVYKLHESTFLRHLFDSSAHSLFCDLSLFTYQENMRKMAHEFITFVEKD